jgi:hypothetical protein
MASFVKEERSQFQRPTTNILIVETREDGIEERSSSSMLQRGGLTKWS